jgi:hypothetical protein
MKAVLIRTALDIDTNEVTREVIRRGQYPNRKMNPIKGLADDLEWLLVVATPLPTIDESTQKYSPLSWHITNKPHKDFPHLNTYESRRGVVNLTAEEIADKDQQALDEDVAALAHNKYKSDGVQFLDRSFVLILRKEKKGVITANQAKKLISGLYDSLEPLYKGLWQLVKVNLAAETPPTNAKLLAIFNKIKNKVDTYVNKNY